MISKFVNSFFLGFIFVLLIDFLIFIGIKVNYIDLYGINEFYNTIFADNQPTLLIFIVSLIFGYLIFNKKTFKTFAYMYVAMILVSFFTLYRPIGKTIGEMLFKKDGIVFHFGKVSFNGDLLYKGRKFTYIYRKDIDKMIKLSNNKVSYSK